MIIKPIIENIEKVGTPEQRAKLCEALRSGKYKQHIGSMCAPDEPNSACCLHVAAMAVDGIAWEDGQGHCVPESFMSPGAFAVQMGLFQLASYDGTAAGAAELNDRLRLTFDQIADIFEGKEVLT